MEADAKSHYTIHFTAKASSFLNKHANLNEPEQVKQFIASIHYSNGYKRNLAIAYSKYCKYYGIQWIMPLYKAEAKKVKIPKGEKLEMLIARASKTLSTELTLSKETGPRPVELCNLRIKDVDLEQRLIYPTTAKNGSSRTLKISDRLQQNLTRHIIENKLSPDDKLFKETSSSYGKKFRAMRNRLAQKLNDPTIQTIRLYDFRHYFATTTYHKTRDLLYTKQQMGHQKIETTLIYTQLLDLADDEWMCKIAKDVKEATDLMEHGFEYVTEMDGLKLFKKRK
jgi:integrase